MYNVANVDHEKKIITYECDTCSDELHTPVEFRWKVGTPQHDLKKFFDQHENCGLSDEYKTAMKKVESVSNVVDQCYKENPKVGFAEVQRRWKEYKENEERLDSRTSD